MRLPAALDAQLQRDAGLTFFEFLVLSLLSRSPERTRRMNEVADALSSSLSRLSHVVSRLEQRGYVDRSRCPGVGRATNVSLTDAGQRKVIEALPGHIEEVRRLLFDPLSDGQVDALLELGRTLRPTLGPPRKSR
jgi:DNA-binding MarR family transcriptional regulator